MPIPMDELSRFFDDLCDRMNEEWTRRVIQGSMSDFTRNHNEVRMEEIGLLLRVLTDGKAVLTYRSSERAPILMWQARGTSDD